MKRMQNQWWKRKICFNAPGCSSVRRAAVAAGLLCSSLGLWAQDLNFTQFYELPLLRNPALAGLFVGDMRVQSVYRNQWQSVTVPYQTTGLSAEVLFPTNDYGHTLVVGTQLLHDVAGDSRLTRTHFLPMVGYQVPLAGSDVYLSGALMGGLVSSSFDPSGLRWADQFVNGQFNPNVTTRQPIRATGRTYFDVGGGLSIAGPATDVLTYYLGVGLFHANNPRVAINNDEVKLAPKWTFNGGLTVDVSDYQRVTLYGDYIYQKARNTDSTILAVGNQSVFMIGGFFTNDLVQYDTDDKVSLTFGGIYRWADALAPMVRIDMKKMAVGISYDINLSKLSIASGARGGFEFSLAYKTAFVNRAIRSYKMKCVGF
jgi:type IX secretion system PorP/SprF family membrane protein